MKPRWVCALAVAACLTLAAERARAGAADGSLDIYWVDTEGGAATLIVTPAGESILVDSGNAGDRDPARILRVARDVARLRRIDHHIITHWHGDHFGGTASLASQLPIAHYYDHGPTVESATFEETFAWYLQLAEGKRTILAPGDRLRLARAESAPPLDLVCVCSAGKVLPNADGSQPSADGCVEHPEQPEDKTDNAQSIGFKLSFGTFDFLDLGDLTWNIEHRLVCPENRIGPVDVFQTSHHGLAVSNNPALVHGVRPRVAVMNNGPRKGGELPVVGTLRRSPGIEAIFQVHRNVRTSDEENAAPDLIANLDEACAGDYVWLKVDPDGKSYTVAAGAKGKPRIYRTR